MPSTSRRTLIAGSIGGLVAAVGGGVAWNAYTTRTHVRFRPLRAVNESDEPVELVVRVVDESDGTAATTHEPTLAPAGETGHTATLRGRSVSYPAPYGVTARRVDASTRADDGGGDDDNRDDDGGSVTDGEGDPDLSLSNAEIVDRHPDLGWGSDDISLIVVVESDGTVSARVGEARQRY
ncbi:hypothetical protein J2751_002641 [Halorubrum alkaliphilum]|uniref:Uncharacterized protein n=1 Tax=Halorubrum alkaliphilum TaxID=261290 RepID=A0A8T4GH97_9EURY|nr:hypothetical protein [Halorubrum alkaliphilum]MBP1923596.1 hypothetical protein [Halorubrum alkaliphilum]